MNTKSYSILNRLGTGSSSGGGGTVVIDFPFTTAETESLVTAGDIKKVVAAHSEGLTVMLKDSSTGYPIYSVATASFDIGGFAYMVMVNWGTQMITFACSGGDDDSTTVPGEFNTVVKRVLISNLGDYAVSLNTLNDVKTALVNNNVVIFDCDSGSEEGFETTSITISGTRDNQRFTVLFGKMLLNYNCNLDDTDLYKEVVPEVTIIGESKPPITDVTELPKGGWKGTVVPNNEMVNTIYINNKLNAKEIIKLFEENNVNVNEEPIAIFIDETEEISIEVMLFGEDEDEKVYILELAHTPSENFITYMIVWTLNDGYKILNNNGEETSLIESFEVNSINISLHNTTVFSSLFSITPFEYISPDAQALYRTPDSKIYQFTDKTVETDEWVGTTVPNSGTVESIYFNTNSTNEEVDSLLSQLNYDNNGALYVLLSNSDMSVSLAVQNKDMLDLGIGYNIFDIESNIVYDSETGWNENYKNYTINSQVINEIATDSMTLSVGSRNDLLSSLFSTTPFTKKTEVIKEFQQINKEPIIDVEELPELPQEESAYLYNSVEGKNMLDGIPLTIKSVESLPETGEEMTTSFILYFNRSDRKLYAYSEYYSGWGGTDLIFDMGDGTNVFGGYIDDESQATDESLYYCFFVPAVEGEPYLKDSFYRKNNELYHISNGEFIKLGEHVIVKTVDGIYEDTLQALTFSADEMALISKYEDTVIYINGGQSAWVQENIVFKKFGDFTFSFKGYVFLGFAVDPFAFDCNLKLYKLFVSAGGVQDCLYETIYTNFKLEIDSGNLHLKTITEQPDVDISIASVPLATSITGSDNITTDKAVKDYVDNKNAIIDVEELPTENIDISNIYRMAGVKAIAYIEGQEDSEGLVDVAIINTLPESGMDFYNELSTNQKLYLYYNTSNSNMYFYSGEVTNALLGTELNTFVTVDVISEMMPIIVVTDKNDIGTGSDEVYIFIGEGPQYFIYKEGWVELVTTGNIDKYKPKENHLYEHYMYWYTIYDIFKIEFNYLASEKYESNDFNILINDLSAKKEYCSFPASGYYRAGLTTDGEKVQVTKLTILADGTYTVTDVNGETFNIYQSIQENLIEHYTQDYGIRQIF